LIKSIEELALRWGADKIYIAIYQEQQSGRETRTNESAATMKGLTQRNRTEKKKACIRHEDYESKGIDHGGGLREGGDGE